MSHPIMLAMRLRHINGADMQVPSGPRWMCRACYGVLRYVMEAGAKGCEVIVTGKLRAARAKAMKFKDGYMISSGNPTKEFIDSAVRHVLLRQGCLGIKVRPPVCVPVPLHASCAVGACCSTAQACSLVLGGGPCRVEYVMLCGMHLSCCERVLVACALCRCPIFHQAVAFK
jgi:hypothetical protein